MAEHRGWPLLAGAAAALLAIKPHLVYLFWLALAVWAVRRPWSNRGLVIVGGLIAGLVATLIPLACNPAVLGQYVEAMTHRTPEQWKSPTIGSLLRDVFGAEQFRLQFVPTLLGLGWLGFEGWRARHQNWVWRERMPLILLVSFVTASYGAWPFDLVILLPAVIQVGAEVVSCGDRRQIAAAGLVFAAIAVGALAMNVLKVTSNWFVAGPALLVGYLVLRYTPACPVPMSRYLRPATGLFLGVWLVLMIGGRSRFFQDPGTFWHVAVGDRLIDRGFFDTDPYTYTFAGERWIPHQWLGEGAMAVVHRALGFDGLLLATATLLATVFAGLGVRLLRCGLHPSLVAVLIAGAVAASAGHFHVRPHLATIAGMAVFMVFLTDVENGRIPIPRLAWLMPVTWLWANTHGGILGGLATFALVAFGWTANWRLGRESPVTSWGDVGKLTALGLGCGAVCFLNPYFEGLPRSWVEIYQMSSLPSIIKEHSRLNPVEFGGITILAFGGLYLVLLMTVPVRRIRIVWLLPIVWFGLACLRVRHAPLFAVAALVGIADFFPATRIAAAWQRKKSDLFTPPAWSDDESVSESARPFVLPAILIGIAVILQALGVTLAVLGSGWARLDPARWPTELLPELREHQYDRKEGTRIFNEYEYGGLLIQQTPGYRVFIDDRCELFGDDFLTRFVEVRNRLASARDWELIELLANPSKPFAEWWEKYGEPISLWVESDGGFDMAFRHMPNWREIKRNRTATCSNEGSSVLRPRFRCIALHPPHLALNRGSGAMYFQARPESSSSSSCLIVRITSKLRDNRFALTGLFAPRLNHNLDSAGLLASPRGQMSPCNGPPWTANPSTRYETAGSSTSGSGWCGESGVDDQRAGTAPVLAVDEAAEAIQIAGRDRGGKRIREPAAGVPARELAVTHGHYEGEAGRYGRFGDEPGQRRVILAVLPPIT